MKENTIILLKGYAKLSNTEFKKFNEGDTIYGENSEPIELKRWNISDKQQAIEELKKYNCKYERYNDYIYEVEEYALEYSERGEDGELIDGCDYDLAETKK